jgi:hypothetical protein
MPYSLSPWERAGVRVYILVQNMDGSGSDSTLTLALSHRERERRGMIQ